MLKVMVETTTTSTAMIRWATRNLMTKTDQLLLARGAAYDDNAVLHTSARRTFDTFRAQLKTDLYTDVVLRPHAGNDAVAFPAVRFQSPQVHHVQAYVCGRVWMKRYLLHTGGRQQPVASWL